MDNVFRERVAGIRERVGELMDRSGNVTIWGRDQFMSWMEHRRNGDTEVLAAVARYAEPETRND